jgi:hypothetical protein
MIECEGDGRVSRKCFYQCKVREQRFSKHPLLTTPISNSAEQYLMCEFRKHYSSCNYYLVAEFEEYDLSLHFESEKEGISFGVWTHV